jgi:hypothetical protein
VSTSNYKVALKAEKSLCEVHIYATGCLDTIIGLVKMKKFCEEEFYYLSNNIISS